MNNEICGRFYYRLDLDTMSLCYVSPKNLRVGDHVMFIDRPAPDNVDSIASTGIFLVEKIIYSEDSGVVCLNSKDDVQILISPLSGGK